MNARSWKKERVEGDVDKCRCRSVDDVVSSRRFRCSGLGSVRDGKRDGATGWRDR